MTLITLFVSYSLILGGLWAFALEYDGHEILFPALHARLRSVVAKLLSVGALIGGTLLGAKAIQKLLINSLEAVPRGETVLRQAQHERENRPNLATDAVHPELVEG